MTGTAPAKIAGAADLLSAGDLPGGDFHSLGLGISAGGEHIAGASSSTASGPDTSVATEAFVWSAATGMSGLGDIPGGGFDSWAYDISRDGSAASGYGRFGPGNNDIQAIRWTSAGGMIGLGGLNSSGVSLSTAISGDGNIVVGGAVSDLGTQAFRWDTVNGMVGIGFFPGGGNYSYARGTNHDGTIIVGSGTSAAGTEAFIWTEADGFNGLGDLPGGNFFSSAYGVSDDGSVVVGGSINALSGSERTPFRWTSSTGMTALGDLPGGLHAGYALAVSADGNVVVGFSESSRGKEGFFWTEAGGMVSMTDHMIANGVDLNGLLLGPVYDVSPDGRFVSGSYINTAGDTEAYIADLQELVVVGIDFDPWSTANEIRPEDAYFSTIGVLSSNVASGDETDFDALQVNPGSVQIGPAGAPNVARPITQDIDSDGDTDLVLGFNVEDSGIICADTEITVSGETYSGQAFTGTDTITTVECETGGCHP